MVAEKRARKKTTAGKTAPKKTAAKQTPAKKTASKKALKGRAAVVARSPEDVFRAVEARAKKERVVFLPGANEKRIRAAEKKYRVTFPPEVRAWFERHDGTAGFDPYLFPLERITNQLGWLSVPPRLVPLGGIDDDLTLLDLREGVRVAAWTPEEGPMRHFDDFLAWLESFAWKKW